MTRKSGNGTSRIQWLYVFWNFPFIWTVKVGISGDWKTRHKQVDKSAPGWDIPIWCIKIPFAYQVEQFVHGLMFWCRVGFWGSGHTERFFILAAIPAILISLAVFVIRWALWGAVVLGVLWLWKMYPDGFI
jgi:hypothetical protein